MAISLALVKPSQRIAALAIRWPAARNQLQGLVALSVAQVSAGHRVFQQIALRPAAAEALVGLQHWPDLFHDLGPFASREGIEAARDRISAAGACRFSTIRCSATRLPAIANASAAWTSAKIIPELGNQRAAYSAISFQSVRSTASPAISARMRKEAQSVSTLSGGPHAASGLRDVR